MILKTLISNELKILLGREPSYNEIISAMTYITDNFMYETTTISDIPPELQDWRDDYCFKCDECGKYFLNSDVYYIDDATDKKMCKDCYWDEDVAYQKRIAKRG